jgi:hypothetical protein
MVCKLHNVHEIENNHWKNLTQFSPNGFEQPKPPREATKFGDSSAPLFSIYSKAAEDEDNKMVERWQKDADGIIIFVSHCVVIYISLHINWTTVDRSVLCRSRYAPWRDHPGPEAKLSGYLLILPWGHLSRSRRPKRNTPIHPLPYRQTAPVFPSEIHRLGEFSLVLEPRHES